MKISEIYKKIKAMRVLKEWSQEETASKLGIAVSSYAKIERGETDINLSRLAQIAEVMEVDISQILELNAHNALRILENCTNYGKLNCTNYSEYIFLTETECVHELEKAKLLADERDKEINHLKEENAYLKEILEWIKAK